MIAQEQGVDSADRMQEAGHEAATGMGIGMGPGMGPDSRRRQGQGGCVQGCCVQNGCSPGDARHQPQDMAFPPRSAARPSGMTLWKVLRAGRHGEPRQRPAVMSKP